MRLKEVDVSDAAAGPVIKARKSPEIKNCSHFKKYHNFTRFPGVEILRKATVSA